MHFLINHGHKGASGKISDASMICVPLAESQPDFLSRKIALFGKQADVLEIRLDALHNPADLNLVRLIQNKPCPLILTNRPRNEGGHFQGGEDERVAILEQAVAAGADYVDIELRTDDSLKGPLIKHAHKHGTKVIISYHDFNGTPSLDKLRNILIKQEKTGADIGKIVTMAQAPADCSTLLSIYCGHDISRFPLIAFCMGEKGKISRIASLALGGPIIFASPSKRAETAPGQIPLENLRQIMRHLLPS